MPHSVLQALLLTALLLLALGVRAHLIAENLFLRHQIHLFQARGRRPRRPDAYTRLIMALTSRLFDWRSALAVVQPQTLIRWQRQAFRRFWRAKSARPGRPPIPRETIELIRQMQRDNVTWGARRIANELKLKLGIDLSHRTVAKYMRPRDPRGNGQKWQVFLRNHAPEIIACDFFTVPTLKLGLLHVVIILELGRRRILHANVTEHPSAQWTIQQFREALPWDHEYRFLIHDRDSIFSGEFDESLQGFGLEIHRTPYHAPLVNAHCERLIGTFRREFLDHVIVCGQAHLRRLIFEWIDHYNTARPHSSLGSDIPIVSEKRPRIKSRSGQKRIAADARICSKSVLGGLPHEYALAAA